MDNLKMKINMRMIESRLSSIDARLKVLNEHQETLLKYCHLNMTRSSEMFEEIMNTQTEMRQQFNRELHDLNRTIFEHLRRLNRLNQPNNDESMNGTGTMEIPNSDEANDDSDEEDEDATVYYPYSVQELVRRHKLFKKHQKVHICNPRNGQADTGVFMKYTPKRCMIMLDDGGVVYRKIDNVLDYDEYENS